MSFDPLTVAHSGDTIGPYTLVQDIGRGSFGVVWLAEKRTAIATTRFALKFARDEDVDLEAFRREADIWVQASGHPNVLPIIEADVYDGQVVIVSEYAPDGSLTKWLQRHGGQAPSVEAAVGMVLNILAGLEHLHGQRIVHRDIKPDNILLQSGTPRLADFGLACLRQTNSYSQAARGTPVYMAPEAFDRKRNEQTDLWSVGVILYRMLAGRLPYEAPDYHELRAALNGRKPAPLPPSIPESLRRIVARALKRDPARRYKSAAEMRRALLAADREMRLTAQHASEKSARYVRWSPRKFVLAALVCVTLIIAALSLRDVHIQRDAPTRRTPVTTQSADGKVMALVNDDNSITLSDARTGEFRRKLIRNGHTVSQLRLSADGFWLAAMRDDYVIELWDTQAGELDRTLNKKGVPIQAMGFDVEYNRFAVITARDAFTITVPLEP